MLLVGGYWFAAVPSSCPVCIYKSCVEKRMLCANGLVRFVASVFVAHSFRSDEPEFFSLGVKLMLHCRQLWKLLYFVVQII